MAGTSTNGDKHPYLKGLPFWNDKGAFWRDPSRKFSEGVKRLRQKLRMERSYPRRPHTAKDI